MYMPLDPVSLAQELIRCPSVTPDNAGVLEVLENSLKTMGFTCHRLVYEGDGSHRVENLFARLGTGGPHICFAGHTDVVPVGDAAAWKYPPFAAEIHDGYLYGRGAEDMKSAVAAFVAAVSAGEWNGSISLLITNDEEGPAVNGTRKALQWMQENGHIPDVCIVGEPTHPTKLGEMIKIGRRGSAVFQLVVEGKQGHVAYPHLAENPVTALVEMLYRLKNTPLDAGTDFFQASNLEVTSIDVGNAASNVIPAAASARFNVRFNTRHTGQSVCGWVKNICDDVGAKYALHHHITGEAFLTPPGEFSALVAGAVREVTGVTPELSTTGGTSDARFIKDYCAVVECGTTGRTSHMVDENVAVVDIVKLAEIYRLVLERFFAVGS